MIWWLHWDPPQSPSPRELLRFLEQDPLVVWWVEPPMFGPPDLVITQRQSPDAPLSVPPGMWVHFDGRHFSWFEKGPDPQ